MDDKVYKNIISGLILLIFALSVYSWAYIIKNTKQPQGSVLHK